jgi:hypothetical protein
MAEPLWQVVHGMISSLKAKPSDESLRAALFAAAENGHVDVMRTLVAAGADTNARHIEGGDSVLHVACRGRHIAAIRLLLESGADAEATSQGSCTPLYVLAWAMLHAEPKAAERSGCGASSRSTPQPFAAVMAEICARAHGVAAKPSISAEVAPKNALRYLLEAVPYTIDDRLNVVARLLEDAPTTAGASGRGLACVLGVD